MEQENGINTQSQWRLAIHFKKRRSPSEATYDNYLQA
jgi:hypothetical protein